MAFVYFIKICRVLALDASDAIYRAGEENDVHKWSRMKAVASLSNFPFFLRFFSSLWFSCLCSFPVLFFVLLAERMLRSWIISGTYHKEKDN